MLIIFSYFLVLLSSYIPATTAFKSAVSFNNQLIVSNFNKLKILKRFDPGLKSSARDVYFDSKVIKVHIFIKYLLKLIFSNFYHYILSIFCFFQLIY